MADAIPIREGLSLPASLLTVSAARSGGPGGQGVNTTDSRVSLRFALSRSDLPYDVHARLRTIGKRWLLDDGDLLIVCDVTRSQHQNLSKAREKLADAVRQALLPPPPPRRKTRPTTGSKERRLAGKARRSTVKSNRGRVDE